MRIKNNCKMKLKRTHKLMALKIAMVHTSWLVRYFCFIPFCVNQRQIDTCPLKSFGLTLFTK